MKFTKLGRLGILMHCYVGGAFKNNWRRRYLVWWFPNHWDWLGHLHRVSASLASNPSSISGFSFLLMCTLEKAGMGQALGSLPICFGDWGQVLSSWLHPVLFLECYRHWVVNTMIEDVFLSILYLKTNPGKALGLLCLERWGAGVTVFRAMECRRD